MTFEEAAAITMPPANRRHTVFSTHHDGERSDADAEAYLYGHEMGCVQYWTKDGKRWIALNGPDGEIDRSEDEWLAIFKAMFPGGGNV